jgi:hypothetical protein
MRTLVGGVLHTLRWLFPLAGKPLWSLLTRPLCHCLDCIQPYPLRWSLALGRPAACQLGLEFRYALGELDNLFLLA